MIARCKLLCNQAGSAMVEFAMALPVLVLMIYGIFQVGLLYYANAGMQHALGEGARMATLCIPQAVGCALPTDANIQTRINQRLFGKGRGNFVVPLPTAAPSNPNAKLLTVNYSTPTDFLLFNGPTVTMSRTKIVYVASATVVPTPPAT